MRQIVLVGIACTLVAGCQWVFNSASNDDAGRQDSGNGDGRPPPLDAREDCSCTGNTLMCPMIADETCVDRCEMTGAVARCTEFVPSNGASWADLDSVPRGAAGALTISGPATINTDTRTVMVGTANSVVGTWRDGRFSSILAVDSLDIASGAVVKVVGKLPLILVVRNTATIVGTIDLSADATLGNFTPGPGGGAGALRNVAATGCSVGSDGVDNMGNPIGGGGGGGGGTSGGTGTNLVGAAACGEKLSTKLQGGSGGGFAGSITHGGGGGGALQISARKQVNISGAILAQGRGGSAGSNPYGGGGGGAGGGILIETLLVTVNGRMYANGGGGGSTGASGAEGLPGVAGLISRTVGNGGGGGALNTDAGDGVSGSSGTGGGGGGQGKIEIRTLPPGVFSLNISPAPLLQTLIFQ